MLALDGYNNTAVLLPQESSNSHNVLLPSGTDTKLLRCLNTTIGSALLLYDPPKGLSTESILLIVIGAVFAAVVGVLLLPLMFSMCSGSRTSKCRRLRRRGHRQEARRKSSTSNALPCVINPIRVPPPAVIILPFNEERPSSGKAGELIEDDEVASITKNAEAFAGTQCDDSVNYNKREDRTTWRWTSFGRRGSKDSEDIEMKGKN